VIVKHNENFLSAYGYNSKLLVKEGEKVKAGQAIAEMGKVGQGAPLLHFEIRKYGKPINPIGHLPKRG
jgi:lipoprotein NlpD